MPFIKRHLNLFHIRTFEIEHLNTKYIKNTILNILAVMFFKKDNDRCYEIMLQNVKHFDDWIHS